MMCSCPFVHPNGYSLGAAIRAAFSRFKFMVLPGKVYSAHPASL